MSHPWPVWVARVAMVAGVLTGATGLTASVVRAQDLDIANGSGPIDVSADGGIDWDSKNQVMTATGNAIAKRGTLTVTGDQLVAHYIKVAPAGTTTSSAATAPASTKSVDHPKGTPASDPAQSGQMQIEVLEAHGHVHITTPTQQADGNDAFFYVQQGTMTLLGEPVHLNGADQTVVAQHRLDYDTKTLIATANQGATVTQKGRTVSAPVMVAQMVKVDGTTVLDHADGSGGVVITTETETAYGSQGNYDAKTGIATLTNQVKILRNGDVFTGTKGIFNLNTNVSRLVGGDNGQRATAFVMPQEKAATDKTKGGDGVSSASSAAKKKSTSDTNTKPVVVPSQSP